MSYTPTTWVSGDVVTAEKLNKLEQAVASSGSAGTVLTFTCTNGVFVGDLTWSELLTAINSGEAIILNFRISDSTSDPQSICLMIGSLELFSYDLTVYQYSHKYTMYIKFLMIYSGEVVTQDIYGDNDNAYPTFTISGGG